MNKRKRQLLGPTFFGPIPGPEVHDAQTSSSTVPNIPPVIQPVVETRNAKRNARDVDVDGDPLLADNKFQCLDSATPHPSASAPAPKVRASLAAFRSIRATFSKHVKANVDEEAGRERSRSPEGVQQVFREAGSAAAVTQI